MSDDNVTPIARKHTCPSCHLEVEHEARFSIEAHGEECMQPEIRMRRVEHALFELKGAHNHLVDVVTRLLPKETHGTSEASPDTQRSGEPVLSPGDGLSERTLESLGWVDRGVRLPPYPGGPLTNPGAAEPERSPDAGADAAGEEPGRT